MRLGDLDALKVHISELILVYSGTELDNAILNAIDNAPTVDLKDIYQEGYYDGHLEGYTKAINEARPQGEWKSCKQGDTPITDRCTNYNYEMKWYWNKHKYCPNCGAAMQKGGKE